MPSDARQRVQNLVARKRGLAESIRGDEGASATGLMSSEVRRRRQLSPDDVEQMMKALSKRT
jgi:hypothetical protein